MLLPAISRRCVKFPLLSRRCTPVGARKQQRTFAEAAKVGRVWVHFPATQADGGQAMWNALTHLAGPTLLTAAIAALGTSVRAVFRYPYMWRYLEFRCRRGIRPPGTPPRCRRSRCCQRCTHQRARYPSLTGQRRWVPVRRDGHGPT